MHSDDMVYLGVQGQGGNGVAGFACLLPKARPDVSEVVGYSTLLYSTVQCLVEGRG